jgi:serine/threonine protein kinase
MKIPMALWPRLMPLLAQVLDLPPAQRPAWLAQQGLDEDTAAALRQLLADRQALEAGEFMAALPALDAALGFEGDDALDDPSWTEGPHNGPDAGSDAGPDAAPRPPRPRRHASQMGLFAGDMLGPYRLIRQLGQGGMSVVWLAERDDGQMRRQVALKMPHAGPGQALLAERLRRERDILASLEHRHIARLYDVGTSPSGLPFLVLEFIEGQALPAYCDAHQLGINDRLQLFLQVLSAVQYAHTKLVLHRDLKPSNILVNQQGEVKLLDFGIAKLIRDGETGAVPQTELTRHSGQVLTPDYAAPEQIAGTPLTTASDVYALGVILFELLTGQRPYRLPRGTRGALEEAILATDPRRPSLVWQSDDVQTHHPSATTLAELAEHFRTSPRRASQLLKGDLDVIVATALQKQAARRYATAEAFAQDIRRHLAHEPIAAQPDTRWYRTRKYVQRHAWALTAVGAVLLALCVGLGSALWQAKQARQEAAKATAIKDFLVGLFESGNVEQADALRKRQQTVEQLLVSSAQALGGQLKDQPQVRVELQGVVGGLLHNLALNDAAIDLRRQRVEQLEAMGASLGERVQALRELGDSQDNRGDVAGAKASFDKGLALCRAAAMDPIDICWGMQVARGQMAVIAHDLPLAQQLIEPAYQRLRAHGVDSPQLAEALAAQGDLLTLQNDKQTSFELYQQAMAVRGRLWGPMSVRLAQERTQLAMSLAQVGRLGQAVEQFEAAHRTMVAALGEAHLNSATIELHLGRLQSSVGLSPRGRAHVVHASDVLLAHPDTVDARMRYLAHNALAEVALYDGRLDEAAPHLQEAMRLRQALADRLPVDSLETLMAWHLDDTGQGEQARALLLATRQRLVASLGEQHGYVAAIDDALGSSYLSDRQWDEARRWFHLAMAPAPGQDASSDGWTALQMATGQFKAAEAAVTARYQRVQQTPRADQYRLSVYTAQDQMARLRMGLGQPQQARPYFEQAIQTLADGYAASPYLAATRARYGLCLLALGDAAGAARQAALSAKAFKDAPHAAAQFQAPLRALQTRLAAR